MTDDPFLPSSDSAPEEQPKEKSGNLGRGLSHLMKEAKESQVVMTTQTERLLHVPVGQIQLGHHIPGVRKPSPELIESIRAFGVLHPILVRKMDEGYQLIAGSKRFAAAKEVGLESIPVRVFRLEDSVLGQVYQASNLGVIGRSPAPETPPPATSSAADEAPTRKPVPRGTGLSSLLEDELNRGTDRPNYVKILAIAAVALIVLWVGVLVFPKIFSGRGDGDTTASKPAATPTRPSGGTAPRAATPTPVRSGVSVRWEQALAGVDGINVGEIRQTPHIVFDDAVFSSGANIAAAQKQRLLSIARKVMAIDSNAQLIVIGHTDDSGGEDANLRMGQRRADTVRDMLKQELGIGDRNIYPHSAGEANPPFPNDTAANKARNRTVTLEIKQN